MGLTGAHGEGQEATRAEEAHDPQAGPDITLGSGHWLKEVSLLSNK